MGIPTYFSQLVKNHSNMIIKFNVNTMQINNFYLDCNSIIYECIRYINFTELLEKDFISTIINSVCLKINEYIQDLKPNGIILIAFDGVAPVAKLEQQRSRRYKSSYQNDFSMKPMTWNTAAITPGTVFMKKLNEEIVKEFSNPDTYNVKQIILSTSDICGEGEHKIFEFIRSNPKIHDSQTTVVYGLDADLIMLAMNHLPIAPNIYLYRETPEYIKSINMKLEPNQSYIINIPELARTITMQMNNQFGQQLDRIHDYIFLCFFLGNDFMPHFPSINIATGGIEKLLKAYNVVFANTVDIMTDGKTIYWHNVLKLIQFLSLKEEEYMHIEHKLRDKKAKNMVYEDDKSKYLETIPIRERQYEIYINPFKSGWQERYYKILFDIEIDNVRKNQICMNYLEGLEWTMKYYTVGCPDWRWCYKYKYPPLLSDLVEFIPLFEKELVKVKKPMPVNELVQLSYVLPKQSLNLLPKKMHDELETKHGDWYKKDNKFVWAYCRYFWESHVDLPHINIDELENIVLNI
jgi:5'-3' exonuclease